MVPNQDRAYNIYYIKDLLVLIGVISVFVGTFFALKQKRVKRLIIYSSIAQIGFLVAALATGTIDGVRPPGPFCVALILMALMALLQISVAGPTPAIAGVAVGALSAIALIALRCLRGSITRQRDAYYPAAGFAIAVFAGIHSLVDFTLQVPAVAATFALLLGTCCAQSWSSLVRRIARTGTRTS